MIIVNFIEFFIGPPKIFIFYIVALQCKFWNSALTYHIKIYSSKHVLSIFFWLLKKLERHAKPWMAHLSTMLRAPFHFQVTNQTAKIVQTLFRFFSCGTWTCLINCCLQWVVQCGALHNDGEECRLGPSRSKWDPLSWILKWRNTQWQKGARHAVLFAWVCCGSDFAIVWIKDYQRDWMLAK